MKMGAQDKTRGNGHTLKHRSFPLNMKKHIFTVTVTKQWHRLSGEAVESLSLDIFRSFLAMVLGSWLCLSREFGSGDPQRSLPATAILWLLCQMMGKKNN